MKKIQKIIITVVVLILPIFIFLFLKGFGSNEFELPIYYTEGNPLEECNGDTTQHRVSKEYIFANEVDLPALISVRDPLPNKFQSDLDNILEKFPQIFTIHYNSPYIKYTPKIIRHPNYNSSQFLKSLNCELILGEDHLLTEAITNKYVLVDSDRLIRGYYKVDDLEDIERLDVELDILLNY